MLERTDLATQNARAQVVLLGHSQNQLSSDVGGEEVRHIDFRNHLVVHRQTQTGAVFVGAIQVHGTGTHEPRAFGLLRKRSARSQCAKNGHGQQVFLHTELNAVERGRPPCMYWAC